MTSCARRRSPDTATRGISVPVGDVTLGHVYNAMGDVLKLHQASHSLKGSIGIFETGEAFHTAESLELVVSAAASIAAASSWVPSRWDSWRMGLTVRVGTA